MRRAVISQYSNAYLTVFAGLGWIFTGCDIVALEIHVVLSINEHPVHPVDVLLNRINFLLETLHFFLCIIKVVFGFDQFVSQAFNRLDVFQRDARVISVQVFKHGGPSVGGFGEEPGLW